jgi:two-component system, OmpR family, sensor histidine kinase TctE
MIRGSIRSLQLRLVVRVATLYVVVTVLVIGILMYRAYDTARSLGDNELLARAAELVKFVHVDPNGETRFELQTEPSSVYEPASAADIFAIRGRGGRLVAASPAPFGEKVVGWPNATDTPSRFSIEGFGERPQNYYGLTARLGSIAGPLSVSVARSADAENLMYSLLRRFIHDIVWAVSLLVVITVVIAILVIRSGLKPIREVSQMAAAIGPGAISVRLPEQKLPGEITPLVTAVNRALDRLEQGFAVQRQFTANAAHELRTPLAIITSALDTMESNDELVKLKADVARMNRIVEQLLRVARLDALALDVSETVNLNDLAAGIVAAMAPWAIARDRTVAFVGPDKPVMVKGNPHAIEDAIRNLVENAVAHSPALTEVTVNADTDGSVSVADRGPGIPPEDRPHILKRFWRRKGSASQGAGLGLAIVDQIMKAHRGTVTVGDCPNGGALISLHFPLADEATKNLGQIRSLPQTQDTA